MATAPPPARTAWPLFRSLQGLALADLAPDLLAGLTLAAIAIPEQMATARLGGFAPEVGFVAFAVATLGFAAFGANHRLSVGADSTITPIFAGSLAALAAAGGPQYAAYAALLAIMVGVILALAGLFRMGWIADLLSAPVITGFLAGISLHIVLSQAPAVLGLPDGGGDVYQRLGQLAAEAGGTNPASLAIGLGVFGLVLLCERISARIPGALIAVLAATAAVAAFGLERRGVAVLGAVSGRPTHPGLPPIGLETATPLVGLAFVVALVVMMQTAATARSFGPANGEPPDIDRDFLGVGVGSVLAGLAGAFPVDTSPPRTAIVAQAGGHSQLSGLVAAAAVALLALFGARVLAHVPTAALAGVLLFVAQRIFRLREFAELMRRTPAEFGLALATMVLIVVLPIQTGVAIGVFLSLAHGVFAITRVGPIEFERAPGTTIWWPASPKAPGERQPGVLVLGFQAPLSFLNADVFHRGLQRRVRTAPPGTRLLVLEASSIVELDFTASLALIQVIAQTRAAGLDFAVARLESVRARVAFDRFGVTAKLAEDHLFRSVEEAVRALASGV